MWVILTQPWSAGHPPILRTLAHKLKLVSVQVSEAISCICTYAYPYINIYDASLLPILSREQTMLDSTQFLKCLADETRLHLTLLVHAEKELCVCELMEALGDSQPKISRHLAQLRAGGLLSDTRRGQWVYYALHSALPDWALRTLEQLQEAQKKQLGVFQKKLKAMKNRPVCCD